METNVKAAPDTTLFSNSRCSIAKSGLVVLRLPHSKFLWSPVRSAFNTVHGGAVPETGSLL